MAADYGLHGEAGGDADEGAVDEPDVSDALDARKARLELMAQSLNGASAFLEAVAVVLASIGVLAGIVIMLRSATDVAGNSIRPYVLEGIVLIVSSVVGGVLYWAVFRAIHLFAVFVEFNVESDVERHRYQWQGESARAKECPDCFEDVWADARICSFCGYRFSPPRSPPLN